MESGEMIIFSIGIMVLDICILMVPIGFFIGRRWLHRKQIAGFPTTKPTFILLLAELINVAIIVISLHFMSKGGDDRSSNLAFVLFAVMVFGTYLLIIFGLPVLNLLFGLAWNIYAKKKGSIISRKHQTLWLIAEIVFIIISLSILSKIPLLETLRNVML